MIQVLIADDEDSFRRVLALQTKRLGFEVREAVDGLSAWQDIQKEAPHVVITDLKMPEMDGMELLQKIRKEFPQIPVVMITAHGTIDTAVEAMKRGAFDYITKPFDAADFAKIMQHAVRTAEANTHEFQRSRSFLRQEEKIIGSSDEMQAIYSLIEKVAQSTSTVLITGEPGTGKEVVARLLHEQSDRRQRPLVMTSIRSSVKEQQMDLLFGGDTKQGWLELAEDGTVYLDEVGALSLEVQSRLLDVFQTSTVALKDRSYNLRCRLVAASDFNLLEKIEEGLFRKDLFYRLNVIPMYLPPLRERTLDIEPLVDHFIKVFSKKFNKQVGGIQDDALFHLIHYPWPGNIRELENVVEYAVNITDITTIAKNHLPPHLFAPVVSPQGFELSSRDRLRDRVDRLEKSVIEDALKSSQGDLLRASQKLGIPPSLLNERIVTLKITETH